MERYLLQIIPRNEENATNCYQTADLDQDRRPEQTVARDLRDGAARSTRHFSTRVEAQIFLTEISVEAAIPDLAISVDERVLISRLRSLAASTGTPMADLADAALDMARGRGRKQQDLTQALGAYLAQCESRNLRPATIRHYRVILTPFAKCHPGDVAAINRQQVIDYICSRYQVEESRKTTRTPLMAFFRWCARQGYCDPNRWRDPLKWRVNMRDDAKIGIMRPAHLRLLLQRLPERLQVVVALLAYTGIRPAGELARLRWDMIDARRRVIDLPGHATKTRRGRVLHGLPDIVWEWVEHERKRQGQLDGPVLPMTYRNFRQAIRKAGVPWSHDVTRHSFASYAYHVLGLESAVETMGHIGGFRMFASRYKASARPWTARLWFSCRPTKEAGRRKTHQKTATQPCPVG
jgi:integrase